MEHEDPLEFTAICPTHGREDITGSHSTGGPDPWSVDELACGCDVLDMGTPPGPTVLKTGKRRTTSPFTHLQGDLENGPSIRDWMHP